MRGFRRWAGVCLLGCSVAWSQAGMAERVPGAAGEAQSRVATPRTEPPAASLLEVQAVERVLLPLGGLWVGDGMALTAEGASTLGGLAAQWQRDFVRVDRIRVVGHVQDAQEPSAHEAALQRARLVQHTLASTVGRHWRYQVEVWPLGASALAGCDGMPAQRLVPDCPLATRAVALEVLGVRR